MDDRLPERCVPITQNGLQTRRPRYQSVLREAWIKDVGVKPDDGFDRSMLLYKPVEGSAAAASAIGYTFARAKPKAISRGTHCSTRR